VHAYYRIKLETTYYSEQCANSADSGIVRPGIEIHLLIKHAQLITELEKEIDDYPEHVCCSWSVSIRENQ
jgi:hypothetical protein